MSPTPDVARTIIREIRARYEARALRVRGLDDAQRPPVVGLDQLRPEVVVWLCDLALAGVDREDCNG